MADADLDEEILNATLADAAAREKEVLRKYNAYRYSGLPVLQGVGVTEVFTCDVLGLDGGDPPGPPQLSMFD